MSDNEDPLISHKPLIPDPCPIAPHPQPFSPRSGEKGERSAEWRAPSPVSDGRVPAPEPLGRAVGGEGRKRRGGWG